MLAYSSDFIIFLWIVRPCLIPDVIRMKARSPEKIVAEIDRVRYRYRWIVDFYSS